MIFPISTENVYLYKNTREGHGEHFYHPGISKEKAKANVEITLQNQTGNEKNVEIKAALKDKQGKIVATGQNKINLTKDESKAQISLDVNNPKLWSVDHPSIYNLSIKVYVDGKETDTWNDEVGLRRFHFDPDKGFFLNGENMKIKGVCLHDDAGALGTPVSAEVWERRFSF